MSEKSTQRHWPAGNAAAILRVRFGEAALRRRGSPDRRQRAATGLHIEKGGKRTVAALLRNERFEV